MLSQPEPSTRQAVENTGSERPPPAIALLVLLSSLNTIGLNIFLPAMPGMVGVFDTSPAAVQLTFSLYLAAFAVATLVYGPLSDRYGRRPMLIAGLVVYTLAPLLCAAAWSLSALIAGRVLQAMGACAGLTLARVIIRDLYPRDRSAAVIALATMMMSMLSAGTPAVGGWLYAWLGWRAVFVATSLLGAAALLWTVLRLRETRPVSRGESLLATFSGCAPLLRSPVFLGFALHGACTLSSWYSLLAGLPYLMMEVLGRPATEYGLWFPLLSMGYMGGNFITSRLAQRAGIHRMIAAGAMLAVLGAAVAAACVVLIGPSPAALFLPFAVVVLSHGLSQPSAIAGALGIDPSRAGSAAGVMGFGQILIAAACAQLTGTMVSDGVGALVAMQMVIAVVSVAAWLLARRAERRA